MEEVLRIYIATPVNARHEATLEKKQQAARKRVLELKKQLCAHLKGKKVITWSSVTDSNVCRRKNFTEAKIMSLCVRKVMESDIILMDDGWGDSKGCKVERFTAQTYGKEIWTTFDLEAAK